MSRRRNLPLTDEQLRRFSPVSVARMIQAQRRMGAPEAMSWAIATAAGNLIAPDGSLRTLRSGEVKFVKGVLLDYERREQLRRMELVPDRNRPGELRPLPLRTQQDRVRQWVAEGFAHRCTRNNEITLIVDDRWTPFEGCPWADCPVPNATGSRSERDWVAPQTRSHRAQRAANASTSRSAEFGNSTSDSESNQAESVPQGVTRGERGGVMDNKALAIVKGYFPTAFEA